MDNLREKLVWLLKKTPIAAINGHIAEAEVCFVSHVFESMADYLTANGVTIQRWIPVTERLPKGGNYLCIVKSSLFRGATYQMILGYDKGGFHDGCICMEDVTHWMPLPEEPKGIE